MFAAKLILTCLFSILASGTLAGPLAEMEGSWTGSGWARETPQGPKEAVRCRLANVYHSGRLELAISGRCVVPGRQISLSGEITEQVGSEKISGRWSNPDGIGNARIFGVQRENVVAFTFHAIDPVTGENLAQNIEWRLSDGTLRMQASDRINSDIKMTDMTFTRD